MAKNFLAQHALFQLQQRNMVQAASWLETSGLSVEDSDSGIYMQFVEYTVMAAVLIAQEKYGEVDTLLARMLPLAEAGGYLTRQIWVSVLQAISFYHQGKKSKAFAVMIQAIELGQPEGYIRSFWERGFSIEALLNDLLDSDVWKRWYKKLSVSRKLIFHNYTGKLLQAAHTSSTASDNDKETSLIA